MLKKKKYRYIPFSDIFTSKLDHVKNMKNTSSLARWTNKSFLGDMVEENYPESESVYFKIVKYFQFKDLFLTLPLLFPFSFPQFSLLRPLFVSVHHVQSTASASASLVSLCVQLRMKTLWEIAFHRLATTAPIVITRVVTAGNKLARVTDRKS